LELGLSGLEIPAEVLLVEYVHAAFWEGDRDVCASRFSTSQME